MPDYKLNIIGTFNNKQLVKALRKAGVDVKNLGKKADDTNKKLGAFRHATAGLRRTLGAVRNNLLLVTFAFGGVAAAIKKTTGMFAEFEKIDIGFRNLGKSAGLSENALQTLTEATDGTVNSMELMRQANNAMLLGIVESEEQMGEMFDVAQRLASALGKDTLFGIESLTTGIGRQSRLMLDNLGIIVKTDVAYKAYAKTLKKNVSELTEQERKTAFINAAMTAAREKVKALGDEQLTTKDKFNQTTSAITEMSIEMGDFFAPAAVKASEGIKGAADGLAEFFRQISETSLETAVRQLKEMGAAAEDIALLQNLVNYESQTDILLNTNEKLKSMVEKTVVLSDEQLENLGVTVGETTKLTKSYNEYRLTKIKTASLDKEELLTQENIKKEIDKITNASFQLAGGKQTISEIDRKTIFLNSQEVGFLREMLIMIRARENAENVLFGTTEKRIKLLAGETGEEEAPVIPGQSKGQILEHLEFMRKFHDESFMDQLNATMRSEEWQTLSAENRMKIMAFYGQKELDLQEKIDAAKLEQQQTAEMKLAAGMAAGLKQFRGGAIIAARIQQTAATVDAYRTINKAMAELPFPTNIITSVAVGASAFANVMQISKSIGEFTQAAHGMDSVVDRPTLILAGEGNKRESVQITPLENPNLEGPQGGSSITLNISAPLVDDTVVDSIIPAIREAIRRGEDIGIT